jgi:hypothetical protein
VAPLIIRARASTQNVSYTNNNNTISKPKRERETTSKASDKKKVNILF